jgi:hypothetical protein
MYLLLYEKYFTKEVIIIYQYNNTEVDPSFWQYGDRYFAGFIHVRF